MQTSTPKKELMPEDTSRRHLLDLYKIYSDDLKKFDTISWQFPLALVSANFIALNWFRTEPLPLVALSIINFLFLLPLAKHVHLRLGVVTALKNLEGRLTQIVDPECVVDFSGAAAHWWLRCKTLFILAYALIALNGLFFIGALYRLLTDEKPNQTNLVRKIWEREIGQDSSGLNRQGIEEFLTIIARTGFAAPWSYSEAEISSLVGRLFTALSKIEFANEMYRNAYRMLLMVALMGKEDSVFAEAAYRWGDLRILDDVADCYVARRLACLSEISQEVESRYTFDLTGSYGRIDTPTPSHPSNEKLLAHVKRAAALFRELKEDGFYDRTLESAIKLGLASLKRDGVGIELELELKFWDGLQVYVDALEEGLSYDKRRFSWLGLSVLGLGQRGIPTKDSMFHFASHDELLETLEFLRMDLDRCRTNVVKGNGNQ